MCMNTYMHVNTDRQTRSPQLVYVCMCVCKYRPANRKPRAGICMYVHIHLHTCIIHTMKESTS